MAAAVADADLVIEAIPEAVEIKAKMYSELMKVLPAKTIVASNSSTMMPSQLVQYVDRPAQFLHIHFANQIWKYNVAEIVGTSVTDPIVFDEAVAFAKAIGMVPITMHKEYPGYILNALLVLLNAALVGKGTDPRGQTKVDFYRGAVGTIHDLGCGWPGLNQIEMNSFQQTRNPDAKLIADKLKEMIDAGQTGRESGQGYHYPPIVADF